MTPKTDFDPSPATILICDDQPENIDVLRGLLKPLYKLQIATNGSDAIALAEAQPPDLILLDISMPDMDGYEVCQRLKRSLQTQGIPVIFVTALYSSEDETRGFEVGAVDYIIKPLSDAVVLARVRTHLAMADQQRHLEQLVVERTRELSVTRNQVIRRLSRAGDYRDNAPAHHIVRMAHYARQLALAHGLTRAAAELIFSAAPMHDIGKIGVPDAILAKDGPLSEREKAQLRQHPIIGATIIGKHDDLLLGTARDIALCHHERWDGSGYPQGLKAEAIPLSARIVAICDVFDALTTQRKYRQAATTMEAMNTICSEAGVLFDPVLVAQFIDILPQIIEIRNRYDDLNGEVTKEV